MKPGLGDSLTRDSTDILRTLNTMDRAVDKAEVDPSRFGLNAGDLSRRYALPWPWSLIATGLVLIAPGVRWRLEHWAYSIGRRSRRITPRSRTVHRYMLCCACVSCDTCMHKTTG